NARSGPGCLTTLHAASTSAHLAEAEPRLEIRPERAGVSPDWRTFGSSPRYAPSLRLVKTRSGRPIAAINVAAQAANLDRDSDGRFLDALAAAEPLFKA